MIARQSFGASKRVLSNSQSILTYWHSSIAAGQLTSRGSVVSPNTEMQTANTQVNAAMSLVGRSVRAIAWCVVASAVRRTVMGSDNTVSRDTVSAIVTMAAGVSVPVVNVAATMANVTMAAAVTMTTAVMEVSSRRVSRWNQEGQGSTSEGNHQQAFHVSVPLKGGRSERCIGDAYCVPNRETSVKHRVLTFCRRFAIAERSHIDIGLSSLWCRRFDCFPADGVIR